jgi:RND family efflux transporter MFP subunit
MGRLEYLGVQEGSRVRKGEVIARIQSADYRAALEAARARAQQLRVEMDQSQRDLDRAERLHKDGLIAATEVENARTRRASLAAQLEAAGAQAQQARASLEHTNVRAPFGGTVLRKDAEVGEMVAPSSAGGGLTRTAIVTMADLSTLEVEVDVNEAYIAQVRGNQPCRITLDAYPDTSFSGVVRQVVPTADRQKATVQVKVSILDRDPRILPEMGAKVEFVRESGATAATAPVRVLVPGGAVVQSGDGAKVWVVEDGKAAARTVDVGPARGEQVEIRRGLSGGEQVVLDAPAGIKEGARLKIKSEG